MTTVVHLTSVHPPSDPRIFAKECRTLADAGYDVVLVAPGAGSGTDKGVRFVDFPKVGSRVRRILGNGYRMARIAERIDGDVYHIHDPELLPTAHRLARRGAVVVYDSHEHLSKSTEGKPYLRPGLSTLVAKAAGAYEHFVVDQLAGVVAATPTIAQQFDPSRTVVVANYPIAGEWMQDREPSFEEFDARPLQAVYIGGITEVRCAPELVAAAALLDQPGAEIHFAGPVSGTPVPEGPRVSYHGTLSRPGVARLLSETRVGLVIFRPIPNHIEALPTKTFEYMAAGLPVVVASATEVLAQMVQEAECGVVVPEGSPSEIAKAIDALLADPKAAFEMGCRGREAVLDRYSWDRQGETLLDFYDRIAPLSPSG